jgi:DNA-directed RNA polymerase subunit beta'
VRAVTDSQIRQIAGMRGLVANPKGEIIPRPIKSNFREGLTVLEYFISTHGARKGLADTALRTADSGYLTRRLVDVSQDVIVREDRLRHQDRSRTAHRAEGLRGCARRVDHVDTAVRLPSAGDAMSRWTATSSSSAGTELTMCSSAIWSPQRSRVVKVRSVLHCKSPRSASVRSATAAPGDRQAGRRRRGVGIVAAQSIGEPGTQLTMRTFHTGGVAGDDITQGLPRVVELFEARTPKGHAPIAEASGVVEIGTRTSGRKIMVAPDSDQPEVAQPVSKRSTSWSRTASTSRSASSW